MLGQGSFGIVYQGRREDTGEIIAVKACPIDNEAGLKAIQGEVSSKFLRDLPRSRRGTSEFNDPMMILDLGQA